jgi:hypothetical protein
MPFLPASLTTLYCNNNNLTSLTNLPSALTIFYCNNNQLTNNLINTKLIFKVTPDIQNDIYNLLVYNNGKEEFYDIAFIPDYKTSIMMNKLFRKIKENNYLDALEESDNEDEFENERIDKYVYLEKSYKMVCEQMGLLTQWGMQCSHPHNLYLQIAAENGLIGLMLFVCMLGSLYFKSLYPLMLSKQWFVACLSFVVLSVCFWPLIGGISILNNGVAALVWLGVGWVLSISIISSASHSTNKAPWK